VSIRSTIAIAAAALLLLVPVTAGAAKAPKADERNYDLDFTLPTAGKSGCSVCHGDPNLVKLNTATTSSIFVDSEALAQSAHAETVCTGCHIDFAYKTPHQNVKDGSNWQEVASQACKNCHVEQFSQISMGAHSPASRPGEDPAVTAAARVAEGRPPKTPTCGDCHGSHSITLLNVERWEESGTAEQVAEARAGRRALHRAGEEVCGQCHGAETAAYADYYHGAAYQRGAPDAPSCWDCHGTHVMLPAADRRSPVNESQLVETCGRCHSDINEDYIQYAQLIHRRADVESGVPIFSFFDSTRSVIEGAIQTVTSWFRGEA
jgi:cytochrome c553